MCLFATIRYTPRFCNEKLQKYKYNFRKPLAPMIFAVITEAVGMYSLLLYIVQYVLYTFCCNIMHVDIGKVEISRYIQNVFCPTPKSLLTKSCDGLFLYETESEIWDGLDTLGHLEFMSFLYFFKASLSSIQYSLIKGAKMML